MHLYKRKKKHFIRWVLVLGIFFLAVLFLAAGSKRRSLDRNIFPV